MLTTMPDGYLSSGDMVRNPVLKQEDIMYKITARIDGMMCGMCEAHVADTIRAAFPDAKKVNVSRKRGEATFLSKNGLDSEKLKQAIDGIGYTFVSASAEPYIKCGLFG